MNIEFANSTHTGSRYGSLNQDASICLPLSSSPPSHLFAVCDGHGELGEMASQLACESFKKYFGETPEKQTEMINKLQNEPNETMEEMFQLAHETILKMIPTKAPPTYVLPLSPPVKYSLQKIEGIDVYVNKKNNRDVRVLSCGTTAVVAVVVGRKLIVGSVGDSCGFLVKEKKGDLDVVDLIPPHNIDNENEKARIQSEGRMNVSDDNYIFPKQAEHVRVCTLLSSNPPPISISKIPAAQLAVTRSLGHVYPSISPIPEVISQKLTKNDRFLFLVSDGVTDRMTPRDAMNIIADSGEVEGGAKGVVEGAIENSFGDPQDNTTCLVVFF